MGSVTNSMLLDIGHRCGGGGVSWVGIGLVAFELLDGHICTKPRNLSTVSTVVVNDCKF